MGDKTQEFDIFQTPLSSHYPIPLTTDSIVCIVLEKPELLKVRTQTPLLNKPALTTGSRRMM